MPDLFGTAADLAIFCRMLLNGGAIAALGSCRR